MAGELYPIFPARWLTRIEYRTKDALKAVGSPVLIIHSVDDDIIPFHHGEALFETANEPKSFLEIRGNHNEGFLISGKTYIDGIGAFLAKHPGPTTG
jgi:hypothetical protein